MPRFPFAAPAAFALFALSLTPLVACSGGDAAGDPPADDCGCLINGTPFACGTARCLDGEQFACSEAAEIASLGACVDETDSGAGTPDSGTPDSGARDSGTRDSGPKPDAGPACDMASTFPCGSTTCTTGRQYCNTVLASGPRCKALSNPSCAGCDSSGEYLSFVSVSSNLCTGGKRVYCADGATGGQMTWGCR